MTSFMRKSRIGGRPRRSWEDHYGGANQEHVLSHIDRSGGLRPYHAYTQDHVLTLAEYLHIGGAGYVACVPGCAEEGRGRRE